MKRAALALSALCLSAWPAAAAPVVTSDSDCPSVAEVNARLADLWSSDNPAPVAARIRVAGAQLVVELASENEPATTRILPADPECPTRAQAAALVIAAWLDTRTLDPLGLPVEVASPTARLAEPQIAAPAGETLVASPRRFLLGAGAFASLDAQGAGAILAGEAAWLRLVGRFGLQAGLSLPLPREMALGPGKSRWWRPVLTLGLQVPLREGPWVVAMNAGPAMGLLLVAGAGFDQDHTDVTLSWGASAGLQLARRRGRAGAYWAELRGLLWPGAQNIRDDVVGATPRLAALPRVEGHLGLGFSFALF